MYSIKRGNRYLLVTLVTYLFGSTLLGLFIGLTKGTMGISLQILISQWGIIFIPIVFYFLITKAPIKKSLFIKKIKPLNVLFSVLLAGAIMPLLSFINILSQFFVKNVISEAILEIAEQPLWISLLLVAVTPAILEEVAMRGIITSNYRSKPVLTTCLISGFFFGMFHMNINQFLYAFVMGIIMCFVVHLTGSILSSMIIHFTINASSLIFAKGALFLQDYLTEINPNYASQMEQAALDPTGTLIQGAIFLGVACLVMTPIAGLIIYGLMKYNKKENILKDRLTTGEVLNLTDEVQVPEEREKVITPSFIISVSLFVGFVVIFEILFPIIVKYTQ
ncbi:MAG: hypothetical protein CVV02_08475 [Firmicutes bacterium HGW-Firmicutes-7]|nr:MAG: hypothetical protein CVV02_08475 [Firmicutes bacterium HGW-Firmicutes-7]